MNFRRHAPGWGPSEFEELIERVSPDLLAYLVRRTASPEDAADVLADTLLTVWRRRGAVPASEDGARAWMFVVARNHLMNHLRGTARRVALADRLRDQLVEYRGDSGSDDRTRQVRDALDCLAEEDQELITLVIWDGLTVAEAGAMLGLSASGSRSRYARAKARFAKAMAEL